ncbi:unnamed protein product [Ascophyllum nodosum]
MRITLYREAVGALMWAATMTPPDVAYAAHQLGKFNDNQRPVYWRAVSRAVQYLWRTKDVDANFAPCLDTPRSVSGGAVMLGWGTISWFLRVYKVTGAASCESEYVALAEVVNELCFLR